MGQTFEKPCACASEWPWAPQNLQKGMALCIRMAWAPQNLQKGMALCTTEPSEKQGPVHQTGYGLQKNVGRHIQKYSSKPLASDFIELSSTSHRAFICTGCRETYKGTFRNTPQFHLPQISLNSVPLHSVHFYARVHTSIYIYIYMNIFYICLGEMCHQPSQ